MIYFLISDAKFWVAVAFVILILLLYKPVKKLLINNIDETINKIKNDIKEGEKVLKESENLLNEIKNRNNSINDEIVVIQEKYSKKLKSAKKELDQKLDSQIIKRKKLSESRINQMEMEIMHLIKEKTIRRWRERYTNRKNITSFIFHDCKYIRSIHQNQQR